jgi:hypothetical protein
VQKLGNSEKLQSALKDAMLQSRSVRIASHIFNGIENGYLPESFRTERAVYQWLNSFSEGRKETVKLALFGWKQFYDTEAGANYYFSEAKVGKKIHKFT